MKKPSLSDDINRFWRHLVYRQTEGRCCRWHRKSRRRFFLLGRVGWVNGCGWKWYIYISEVDSPLMTKFTQKGEMPFLSSSLSTHSLTSHAYMLLERIKRLIDRRPPGREEVIKWPPVSRDQNSTCIRSKPIDAWVEREKRTEDNRKPVSRPEKHYYPQRVIR